jgi:hypothetical protein
MNSQLKNVAKIFPLLLLGACSSDIGIHKEFVEEIVIEGDMVVQTKIAYDQAIDIIFFIDQSGSMRDEETRLLDTMPAIYETLVGPEFTDLKWRVGVKSTDQSEGTIEKWVDSGDENALLKLSTLQSVDNGYSLSDEAGLDAAIESIAWDSEFHRQDAMLLNVFISDEEDQSGYSPQQYEQVMRFAKEEPFQVLESAIVGTGKIGCEDTSGTRYMEVAETIIDICTTTGWEASLDSAKEKVISLNKLFYLEYTPMSPDTIEVYVNDELWEMDRDWIYTESTNSVMLLKVPESRSPVVIAYLI